jgi:hypothetical protein
LIEAKEVETLPFKGRAWVGMGSPSLSPFLAAPQFLAAPHCCTTPWAAAEGTLQWLARNPRQPASEPMKRQAYPVVPLLALWPATACASDMTGLLTFMTLLLVVAPLTVIHLTVTLVFALTKLYRSKAAAIWHSVIACVAPIAGMTVTLYELPGARHADDRAVVMAILFGVLALSWLPLLIHQFQRPAR